MFELKVVGEFAAAHSLRDYEGKCEKLHGHNWNVEIAVSGTKLDKSGMVLDFKILRENLSLVLNELDHEHLNEVEYFKVNNPTSENLSRYIFEKLEILLKSYGVKVNRITVWETGRQSATYFKQ